MCAIGIFLLTLAANVKSDTMSNDVLQLVPLSVEVGNSVNSTCGLKNIKNPLGWYINQTQYNFNRLPADYSILWTEKKLYFIINEAKLWMNNTVFGCYDIFTGETNNIFLLYVTFEFEGPQDVEVKLGEAVIMNCTSSFLIKNHIYAIWNINGSYYNPTRLPDLYLQKEDGIYIHNATKELNNTSFQCLINSNKLYKNGLYASKTAMLKISSSDTYTSSIPIVNSWWGVRKFKFNHQEFIFGEQFTIAWNDANCQKPFNYYLVKSSINAADDNKTNLYEQKNVTLSKEELVDSNKTVYQMYILASVDGIEVCSVTEEYLLLEPEIEISLEYILPGGYKCFDDNNLQVIWPFSLTGDDYCICDDWSNLGACDCIDDTIYDVDTSSKNKICWENLTHSINQTKIYFVNQSLSNTQEWLPTIVRNYLLSYELIIIEPPGTPVIYDMGTINGSFRLFVSDTYTGNSPITQYEINITDKTQNFYNFVYAKEEPGNSYITFPDETITMMSEICGPQKVNIVSRNKAGASLPAKLTVSNGIGYLCDCILQTITVNFKQMETTHNSLSLEVVCETNYANAEKNFFGFTLEPKDAPKKNGNCSQKIQFNGLQSGKGYKVFVQWRHCAYDKGIGPFQTEKNILSRGNTILIVSILSVAIISLITYIILQLLVNYCCDKCKRRRSERND